jgi:CheY-like chemotaxis protein
MSPTGAASADAFGLGARSPQASEASAQRPEGERRSPAAKASELHKAEARLQPDRPQAGAARGVHPASSGAPDRPQTDRAASRPAPPPATHEGPRFDSDRLVLVAHADPDVCKRVADSLEAAGLQVLVAHDGVEAILSIHRALPRAVVLDAALPKMFGFQVCELVKRNESLGATRVVLVGAIHKEDRYRRPPSDLYGADVYLEPHDLADSLLETLSRLGIPGPASDPAPSPPRQPGAIEAPVPSPRRQSGSIEESASADALGVGAPSEPQASEVDRRAGAQQPDRPQADAPPADPLAGERAKAERLARIVVSDIVLYNREKFEAAVRSGDVVAAMRDELQEGRSLFRERIDAQVRDERDHLAEELQRVARTRGGQ